MKLAIFRSFILIAAAALLSSCASQISGSSELASQAPFVPPVEPVLAASPPPPTPAQPPSPMPAPPPAKAPADLQPVKVTGSRLPPRAGQGGPKLQGRLPPPAPPPAPPAAGDISPDGSMAYHIPPQMTEGVTSRVDLWISLNMPVDQLKAKLAEALHMTANDIEVKLKPAKTGNDAGADQINARGNVYVGEHMTATLRGNDADFIIDPKGPRAKSLTAEGLARWDWSVTPKHPANTKLKLVLEASIDRGVDQDAFPSIYEDVAVAAIPQTAWQKALGLIKAATDGITAVNGLLSLLGIASVAGLLGGLKQRWGRRTATPETADKPAQEQKRG